MKRIKYNYVSSYWNQVDLLLQIFLSLQKRSVLRGTLLPTVRLDLNQRAEALFNRALLDIPTISIEEIYAGKICASLER